MNSIIPSLSAGDNSREFRDMIFDLISRLTGRNNLLTIPREFVSYAGSWDAAILLSQLLYWTDRGGRDDGFIYKTYAEWQEEIFLSDYEVRKAATTLKAKGILETTLKKANGAPTVHYRLNKRRFSESFLEFLKNRTLSNSRNDSVVSQESLTESTSTNSTTETTTFSFAAPYGDGNKEAGYEGSLLTVENGFEDRERVARFFEFGAKLGGGTITVPDREGKAANDLNDLIRRGVCAEQDVYECAAWMQEWGLFSDQGGTLPRSLSSIQNQLPDYLSLPF